MGNLRLEIERAIDPLFVPNFVDEFLPDWAELNIVDDLRAGLVVRLRVPSHGFELTSRDDRLRSMTLSLREWLNHILLVADVFYVAFENGISEPEYIWPMVDAAVPIEFRLYGEGT